MSTSGLYLMLNHLDAPNRYLSLTIDEFCFASIGFFMLAITEHKIISSTLCLLTIGSLRLIKKGSSPKVLLIFIYWYFPHCITKFLLPKLPESYKRIWIA